MTNPHIRSYRAADLESLYEICLRTGDAGQDATELMEDPKLLGEIYAAPYGVLEPDHAFVLDDGEGVAVGYVLGAIDTESFNARCEQEWWPALRARHPEQPQGRSLDALLISLIHTPIGPRREVLTEHPSHLHIDLLPPVQGQGWGRRMLEHLFDVFRRDGSPGVHWGVSAQNHNAIAFYRRLGCTELSSDGFTHTFAVAL